MSGSGRISCPLCGANNFDTVTVCWKCGASLAGGQSRPPTSSGTAATGASHPPQHVSGVAGYSSAAGRSTHAAFWLGLLFPYIGLPVGLVFMMLDDDRRYEIGRLCVIWSCVSLAVHILVLMLVSIGMREILFAMIQGARGAASRAGGMGGYGGPGL